MRVLGLCVVGLFAGHVSAEATPANRSEKVSLRAYVEQRWLNGSPEQNIEMLEQAMAMGPVRAAELVRRSPIPEATKQKIREGIQKKRNELGVLRPDLVEMQQLFDSSGDCIEKEISNALNADEAVALRKFINSGFYRRLPELRKPINDWVFVALQRQSGVGKALATKESLDSLPLNPQRSERLLRLQEVYILISDSWSSLQFVHDYIGAGVFFSVMAELLLMSEDLPSILAAQGLSDQEISELEAISQSNFYKNEASAVERCRSSESAYGDGLKKYLKGYLSAIESYFQANPSLLPP